MHFVEKCVVCSPNTEETLYVDLTGFVLNCVSVFFPKKPVAYVWYRKVLGMKKNVNFFLKKFTF